MAITVGRAVAVALPVLIVAIFARFGQAGVIGMVAGVLLALAIAVALFGAPTRGRSLDMV
jgi:hypothetical protein